MAEAELSGGCDSGFGHALVKHLDKLDFTVFAGVLHHDGPGAVQLKETCSDRVLVLQLDITSSEQIEETFIQVKMRLKNQGLWGVVNNAGVLEYVADAELLPISIYKQCMEVNYFGAVRITKMFLPLLRQAKGRLVNISSLAGNMPLIGFAAYGASKAALSIFSSILRLELSKWGVKVATVQPTNFKTGIFGTSNQWNNHQKHILEQLPQDVKMAFGENYIFALQDNLVKWSATSQDDLQPILNDISNALMAVNPKRFYNPGQGAVLLLTIHQYLPTWLCDLIIQHLLRSRLLPAGVLGTAHKT